MTNKEAINILTASAYLWDRTTAEEQKALNYAIGTLEDIDKPRYLIKAGDKKSAQEIAEKFKEALAGDKAGLIIASQDVEVIPLPQPDAFSREELEAWLWQIALNNTDNNAGEICKEIIGRLDGFERFCKDRREGRV